jgi:hypothetical protein
MLQHSGKAISFPYIRKEWKANEVAHVIVNQTGMC